MFITQKATSWHFEAIFIQQHLKNAYVAQVYASAPLQ